VTQPLASEKFFLLREAGPVEFSSAFLPRVGGIRLFYTGFFPCLFLTKEMALTLLGFEKVGMVASPFLTFATWLFAHLERRIRLRFSR